ncbi:DUF4199 domain-containing protein [Psychroserpens sp. Hel_I_66]|uniref:DUF4199 domain-containing protein n=1 Tax=Psychroserpens sp. Hel_I_66 TaxID=1250004 RepID=UPI000647E946|nr:DUF4199 domain-containing protein [Psychroserpens sp. Hel_I_66]
METKPITAGKFGINYGVILGVVMIAISVVTYVTGMALEGVQWPNYIYYIIFPVTIFYAISKFKQNNANVLTVGSSIKLGVIIGVISALVYIAYFLVFNYVIDPEFMTQMMEVAQDNMIEQNPDMSQDQLDQSLKFMEMFQSPGIISAFWIGMSALFGLIWSLIAGLVMKSN